MRITIAAVVACLLFTTSADAQVRARLSRAAIVEMGMDPPEITDTSPLMSGTEGQPYSKTLTCTGGTAPYTWSLPFGSLPSGLSLSTAGVISGTIAFGTPGMYELGITCTDSLAEFDSEEFDLTVDFSPPVFLNGTSLSGCSLNVACTSSTLACVGGQSPYTYTVDTGALPDGMSLNASTGEITGTPTESGTANLTAKCTDALMEEGTKAFTLNVSSGSEGPYDYFNDLLEHEDCWVAYSLRPQAGNTDRPNEVGCAEPHYESQIDYPQNGGYLVSSEFPISTTYNYAGDTDPQKQDASKFVIPPFHPIPDMVLAAGIDSDDTIMTFVSNTISNAHSYSWLLDTEIVQCFHPDSTRWCIGGNLKNDINNASGLCKPAAPYSCSPDYGAKLMHINRGRFSSTAASHATSTSLYRSYNKNTNQLHMLFPEPGTEDGHTYFISLDQYWTDSWIKSGLTSQKSLQFRMLNFGRFWESRARYAGGSNCSDEPTFNNNIHIAVVDARIYNTVGGNEDWSLTNGTFIGPQPGGAPYERDDPLCPMSTPRQLLTSGKWYRWYWFWKQNANDYDEMTMWVWEEGAANPTMIHDSAPMSVYPTSNGIEGLNFELDTSTDQHVRGQVGGNPDGLRSLVSYFRHLIVLKDLTEGEAIALMAAPVPGN